ncbi:nucleotidyltransferase domain-containing protein [Microbacterium sp.]|uniref:nucleotidyltransferase domain-containing protein n=1 Tax=Microbacterium sp. TaxID=51671 RepID=UPI0025D43A9B|nr:nucleotidyltransferase domain-containing protein [Microbacterium sp.]
MRRLVEQGIVLEHRIGRSATYELNDEHLAAVPIRALAAMKSSLLDRLRAAVADWPNPPVFGAMFGSAARGDMRAQSDLDILLVREAGMSDESWLSHVVRLSASATAWTGNDARIVDVTEDDIDDPSIRPLLDEVLADGIAFTDDSGWLTRVLRALQADMRS